MLEIVFISTILIFYAGILYFVSKEQPKPKLFIFWLILFLTAVVCLIGIETYNTYNTPATFGFEEHDYMINSQGIIEHSKNCHCYD